MSDEQRPAWAEGLSEAGYAAHSLNLWQKIAYVRASIDYLKKDTEVSTGRGEAAKYPAVSHDKVTDAVADAMNACGLVVNVTTQAHERERIDRQTREGTRTVFFTTVQIIVTLINADNPEEREAAAWIGYGVDNGDKGIGKAYSYAVKYAYLKWFQIPTGEDEEQRVSTLEQPEEVNRNTPGAELRQVGRAEKWIVPVPLSAHAAEIAALLKEGLVNAKPIFEKGLFRGFDNPSALETAWEAYMEVMDSTDSTGVLSELHVAWSKGGPLTTEENAMVRSDQFKNLRTSA